MNDLLTCFDQIEEDISNTMLSTFMNILEKKHSSVKTSLTKIEFTQEELNTTEVIGMFDDYSREDLSFEEIRYLEININKTNALINQKLELIDNVQILLTSIDNDICKLLTSISSLTSKPITVIAYNNVVNLQYYINIAKQQINERLNYVQLTKDKLIEYKQSLS